MGNKFLKLPELTPPPPPDEARADPLPEPVQDPVQETSKQLPTRWGTCTDYSHYFAHRSSDRSLSPAAGAPRPPASADTPTTARYRTVTVSLQFYARSIHTSKHLSVLYTCKTCVVNSFCRFLPLLQTGLRSPSNSSSNSYCNNCNSYCNNNQVYNLQVIKNIS